jgi:hypothetical protein
MPSHELKNTNALYEETFTEGDISDDDFFVEGKGRKRARADAALAAMFGAAIPKQTIDADQHVILGDAIAKGDKEARNEYISHRLRAIMIAAIYRHNSQEPIINLDLEDHFQHILEKFIEKIDDYEKEYIEYPNFSEYANRHLYWIGMKIQAETQSLPMTGLTAKYRNRKKTNFPLFSQGTQPYHEIDPRLQGSSAVELLDYAVHRSVELGLEHGIHDELSQRNGEILKMKTGILSDSPHTLAEVADDFDLSPQRIRQIEHASIKALTRATGVQNLRGIFEDVPEGDFLNQNTPPSLYTVKKAIETLPFADKSTPEGKALEVFVNTWKDSYFPAKKRRVTQTEAAQARFKIKRAKKFSQKDQ